MNDKFTDFPNADDDAITRKLDQAAEQTHVNGQFAADLETRLRNAHPARSRLAQVSPVLRWVAVMALLALVLSWSIKTLIPAPQPAHNSTPVPTTAGTLTPASNIPPSEEARPVVQEGGYDWRQTKLYISVPLPTSPAQANIYSLKPEQPATVDMALAVAEQFGVHGSVFQVPGRLANQSGYLVPDGKQRMYVQSDVDYAYYADYAAFSSMSGAQNMSDEQAAAMIDAFLKSHGLDFPYRFENPHILPGMYFVLPTTPEGLPVYHDHSLPDRLEFILDENGQVIMMAVYRMDYEAVGPYGIRTAEEAFQQILDADGTQNGVLEIMRSAGLSPGAGLWLRSYPDDQTITIYGQPAFYPAAQAGGASYAGIGQFTAIGDTSGMETLDSSAYIEATGRFLTENGIRRFHIDSWKVTEAQEVMPSGSLRQENGQIIFTADDGSGEYILEDAPSGLPLHTSLNSYLAVHGFLKDGRLHWDNIQYYPAGSGGGGGGSGTGFYKLNLSGTPVPFPTSASMPGAGLGNPEHIVQNGDTLQSIAEAYGTTPEKIFQANHMQGGDALVPGMLLTIPVQVTSQVPGKYIVKEGDTCASIADSFNISIRSIVSENNLSENCILVVGDVLKIPGPSSASFSAGQRIEGVRGILMVTIYRHTDGSERVEYGLYPKPNDEPFFFAALEGEDVQNLEAYHNHPIDVWGTITGLNSNGMPKIQVERYEVPYPDLQFQLLTGKQKEAELEGERVALFTASDGTTYVQLTSNGFPDITMPGTEGSDVILQILAIPGDSFGGYPALRVFDAAIAVDPINGQPAEFTGSAEHFYIVDESVQPGMENYVLPDLTIEKVELVYYVPDPRVRRGEAGSDEMYLQPAWRFYGHYSDGSQVEFLVQALKQEFLLPELAPYSGPG